jgi:hypothetical protein
MADQSDADLTKASAPVFRQPLNRIGAIILQNQIRAAVRRTGSDSLEIASAGQPDGYRVYVAQREKPFSVSST